MGSKRLNVSKVKILYQKKNFIELFKIFTEIINIEILFDLQQLLSYYIMKRVGIFMLLFSQILLSCQETEAPIQSLPIHGTWQQRITLIMTPENTMVNEYHFKEDGTYELALKIINNTTHEPVEYFNLITGSYEIEGNKLKRLNVNEYKRETTEKKYNRSDLVHKSFKDELPLVIVSLDEKADNLTMDYRQGECPNPLPTYCIDVESFIKWR